MKSALALLFCVGAHAAGHIDIMAALHKGVGGGGKKFDVLAALHSKGHKKKHSAKHIAKSDPTGLLGQIMQATGQGLAAAEAHHEQAVKTARTQVEALLQKESASLTQAIQKYDRSLAASLDALSASRNASKKDLEVAENASNAAAPTARWDADAGHDQAQLNAQLSFVEREMRRAERKHQSGVKMALSRAQLLLEDGVQPLSRKVGDMSEMLKPVQDKMDEDSHAAPQPAAVSLAQQTKQAVDLQASTKALLASKKKADGALTAAQKVLDGDMDGIEKSMAVEVKAIGDAITKAQEEEIQGVRASSGAIAMPDAAPKKKAPEAPKKKVPEEPKKALRATAKKHN
eukprot:TRINITY_DN346_c0_g1_i1.p2 TRINITY_DN346_c0_g1~~TRINITY_DN346_c0_g1_i1.p2  ORF type:complete len:345 (+),score=156.40 TRINITY_DN346_c0_g1_i1:72-1106(+)